MTNKITTDILDAVKVKFLKPIFEDDFPERGMKAWLTHVEYDTKNECYKLYFDFTDFENENDKYLTESYFPNRHTVGIEKALFTAKEAGCYNNKYNVYFDVSKGVRDDPLFEEEIKEYLVICE